MGVDNRAIAKTRANPCFSLGNQGCVDADFMCPERHARRQKVHHARGTRDAVGHSRCSKLPKGAQSLPKPAQSCPKVPKGVQNRPKLPKPGCIQAARIFKPGCLWVPESPLGTNLAACGCSQGPGGTKFPPSPPREVVPGLRAPPVRGPSGLLKRAATGRWRVQELMRANLGQYRISLLTGTAGPPSVGGPTS